MRLAGRRSRYEASTLGDHGRSTRSVVYLTPLRERGFTGGRPAELPPGARAATPRRAGTTRFPIGSAMGYPRPRTAS
ncbi:hypothetical protein GCM10022245_69440 [Streptomyces mayteni]